ncbi:MAG TPA: hypothetical protein DEA08_34010 [Planctomycetes bacterium]|nr:hypothetical protein [Planctomycetota bacterium]
MSASRSPLLVLPLPARHLPRARKVAFFLRAHFGERRLSSELVAAFRFVNDERAFARALVERKSNLWLFRCNQRAFCGDFVVVDMSSPDPRRRPVWVIDLKRGAPLRLGGGGAGVAFRNAGRAVRAVASGFQILGRRAEPELVTGDRELILEHLSNSSSPAQAAPAA